MRCSFPMHAYVDQLTERIRQRLPSLHVDHGSTRNLHSMESVHWSHWGTVQHSVYSELRVSRDSVWVQVENHPTLFSKGSVSFQLCIRQRAFASRICSLLSWRTSERS